MGTPMNTPFTSLGRRTVRLTAAAVAAVGFAVAPTALFGQVGAQPAVQNVAQPCVNGVVPGNPYIVNCNLGPRPPRVAGSAPDAGAIIACRGWPGCLSWYVNGGP